ncbi:MAG: hypothetical protein JSS75_02730 [Bacteroidetes bacterium]|nr:hypothetical protein [Bacteroidota bacterium]
MKTTTIIRRTFLLFALAGATTQAVAQPNDENARQQRIDRRIEHMKKHLAISDEQASKIASVLQTEHKVIADDRAALRAAAPEGKLLARTQLQKDRIEMRSQVLANLNANQLAKAEELRKRHAAREHIQRMSYHDMRLMHR